MPLIDPSLMNSLGFLFEQTVTIQQNTGARDSFGGVTDVWADLSGHVNLPCVVFPAGGNESKGGEAPFSTSTHKIQLQHAYPSITPEMRAVTGGKTMNILAVETDPMGITTKLMCEIVR